MTAAKSNILIQAAVDRAAKSGGGLVEIPKGLYSIHSPIRLRSNVHLVGEKGTILRAVKSVESPLLPLIGFGHYEFQVKHPSNFKPGMGITIGDKNAFGFYETVATIVAKDGNSFFIDQPFPHDYNPRADAHVRSIFPIISGLDISDASITSLTIEGHPKEKFIINGCRGGGINLLRSHRIVVDNVEVKQFNGDAISFQSCTDIFVRNCRVHHNRGTGIHPGSGSVRYVISNNRVHYNGGHGIFYCLRTTHSLCEENTINSNGRTGISIGERDTDHSIRNNYISLNAEPGIHFREAIHQGGDRVRIEANHLSSNCQKTGRAEIALDHNIHQVEIVKNQITPLASKFPVQIGPLCDRISVDPRNPRTKIRSAGPKAAPSGAARHLNIAKLPRWIEK